MVGLIGFLIAVPLISSLMRNYTQYDQKLHSQGEVELLADYLQDYLQPNDVVVVTSPDTVVLKYYLRRNGLAKEFTELEKGKLFERAIVVVNQAQGQTLEYVLERRQFLDDVNIASVDEIRIAQVYLIDGDLSKEEIKRICDELLTDGLTQDCIYYNGLSESSAEQAGKKGHKDNVAYTIEVARKQGVMDPVESTVIKRTKD